MENIDNDLIKYFKNIKIRTIKDYVLLVRNNLLLFMIISIVTTLLAMVYIIIKEDVYESIVLLKISKHKQILESSIISDVGGIVLDRFIANEVEILKNYDTRERFAYALVDSFRYNQKKYLFKVIKNENGECKSVNEIAELLEKVINVDQVKGLDIIKLSAESPIAYEAALIANTCANIYKDINLEVNRTQLTSIRKFFAEQSRAKLEDLNNTEDTLKVFQQKGRIVALDAQSSVLINQLAQLDALRDATRVDLMASNEVLTQLKSELNKQDPYLINYLENQTSQAYVDVLQKQIADLQMNRDLAISAHNTSLEVVNSLKETDNRIAELKNKLSTVINNIKAEVFVSSPEQIKELVQKLIEEKVNNNALSIKHKELQIIISKYESSFNKLPKKSIELAQYQRRRESVQQLYLLVEQKYQEAMINELSQPGNVLIIGKGRIPDLPAKPNRQLIIFIGLFSGVFLACCFILVKEFLDDTVKTPKDIQDRNLTMLSWIPYHNKNSYLIKNKTELPISESLRALRTRLQYAGIKSFIKTILVTSPAEGEGKTFLSVNLASSFAQAGRKTLLIDFDIRRPLIHEILNTSKLPGLIEYLCGKAQIEEIIKQTEIKNLYFTSLGIFRDDPAELLQSDAVLKYLDETKKMFDIIIVDSSPLMAVIDSEILSKIVDGVILLVSANKTKIELMTEAIELLHKNKINILGIVLNKFKNKNGYSYYYKYYYNYNSNVNNKKYRKKEKRILTQEQKHIKDE